MNEENIDILVPITQATDFLKLPLDASALISKLQHCGVFSGLQPKREFIDGDYFRLVKGNPIETSKGLMIPVTVYCTQKGLAYINLKFGNGQNNNLQLAQLR